MSSVPSVFRMERLLAPPILAKERYDWSDPTSLDFSLCSMVFMEDTEHKAQLASPESFDC
jgi:hypothetical protein